MIAYFIDDGVDFRITPPPHADGAATSADADRQSKHDERESMTNSKQPGQQDATGNNPSGHSDAEPSTGTSPSISKTAADIASKWATHGPRLEDCIVDGNVLHTSANFECLVDDDSYRPFFLELAQTLFDADDSLIDACGKDVAPTLKRVKVWYSVWRRQNRSMMPGLRPPPLMVDSSTNKSPPRRNADDTSSHPGVGPANDSSTSDSDRSTADNRETISDSESNGQ